MADRKRMSRADRAKQFMPFAALKGYEDALRAKEKIVVPRRELSEEMAQELDRKLHQIRKNDVVTVVYYDREEYIRITGMVSRVDMDGRILKIVNTKIGFENISAIEV